MTFLKDNSYKILKLDELYDFIENKIELPKRSVLITFDDGRKNLYMNTYPILKLLNFSAVAFIITGKITSETQNYSPTGWQYLSEEELKKGSDVFEYASYTNKMHERDEETNQPLLMIKSDEEIKTDIEQSLKYVKKSYFAYPYGAYKNETISILKELQIKGAFTVKEGMVHAVDSLYELKRNGISELTTHDEFLRIIGYND